MKPITIKQVTMKPITVKSITAKAGALLIAAAAMLLFLPPAAQAAQPTANRSHGLTNTQAANLQRDVNRYLKLTGGHQVAANRIEFDGGNVTLPLPGVSINQGTLHGCVVGDFCAYSGQNYSGTRISMYYCTQLYGIPWWWTFGSWMNNQIGSNARAIFIDYYGYIIATTLPPVHSEPYVNWLPVERVRPCPLPH